MKKAIYTLAIGLLGLSAYATGQYLKVTQGDSEKYFQANDLPINVTNGQIITIQGETFNLSEISSINVVNEIPESAPVVGTVVDYTFAQGELFNYGKAKKENIDVAMCINDPSISGYLLKGFKAYIATADGLSGFSLWGSSELVIENKLNVPDLFSYNVTPRDTIVGDNKLQVLEIELPEPYTLTEEPLYIGYSLVVDDATTEAQKYPIILADNIDENGLYLHMSKSVLKWLNYTKNAGGVAFIVADIQGVFPKYSLGFKNSEVIYSEDNEDYQALFEVRNIGGETINNLTYTYTYDNEETLYVGTLELDSPIAPSLASSSVISLPFQGVEGFGPHELNVTITEVNGKPNGSSDAAYSTIVNVIPFRPVHRPLVEEYTGLWCGWCPRGFLAMEEINKVYGDNAVVACYHNGDDMQVTRQTPIPISGYPMASLDRNSQIDPYYGATNSTNFGIYSLIDAAIDQFTLASIDVEATLEGNTVNVNSTAIFIQDMDKTNYQIGYLLICNGLSDPTWGQENYFAGQQRTYAGTPLEELTEWPSTVYGLVFNDVIVNADAMFGVQDSLPSSIVTAQEYNHTYSFNIAGNELVQDVNNLEVVAFIVDKNTGKIVNSNKYYLNSPAE